MSLVETGCNKLNLPCHVVLRPMLLQPKNYLGNWLLKEPWCWRTRANKRIQHKYGLKLVTADCGCGSRGAEVNHM
jgi:hypothetical protein